MDVGPRHVLFSTDTFIVLGKETGGRGQRQVLEFVDNDAFAYRLLLKKAKWFQILAEVRGRHVLAGVKCLGLRLQFFRLRLGLETCLS